MGMLDDRIRNGYTPNELVWDRDYFVRYIKLPRHIGGVCSANEDGTYNIYLNSMYYDRRKTAFNHELAHCSLGHLDQWKELPDDIKEWEADHIGCKVIMTA